jgi:two-component system chemotaxis response regulator CheB
MSPLVRGRNVVVIGGSAGAVEALFETLAMLPPDLKASVAIVLHRHPTFASSLGALFSRRSTMPVVEPEEGQAFKPGRVYLAPQDRHMTVGQGVIHLSRDPKQHHTRPAIDPLFMSAAEHYGSRVVGALLTGNLSDGVSGLIHIKEEGGVSLVQDPAEAPYPSMPRNALIYDHVDLVFRISSLGRLLARLVEGESVQSVSRDLDARVARDDELTAPRWLAPGRRLP